MSALTQIEGLAGDIAEAYEAVSEMGGVVPEEGGSVLLPVAIRGIPHSSKPELVKHFGKILVGNGDTDKIVIDRIYPEETRFVQCSIIGVNDVIDPSTGDEVYYGNMIVSSNFKPSGLSDLADCPLKFKFRFKNKEGKTLLLKESLSQTATRMMSFQGKLRYGADALNTVLEGVYADITIANSADPSDKYVSAVIEAVQPIKGDEGYTYWIEFQTPICWTYE